MRGVSVVIPVYNELKSVNDTFSVLGKVLRALECPYEIIAVDDASTDGTREALERIKGADDKVQLLRHRKNKGYGASLKTGIKAAKYTVIFIADCDGTYPLERIPEFVDPLLNDECDMMVGARLGRDAAIPVIRKPAKWVLQILADYLTGEKIPDLNSGFRAMKKDAVMKFINLLPDGFSFTTTITIAMLTNDHVVKYEKIAYKKRVGHSKINPVKDTIAFIKLIIRTVLYFNPLKIFLPLSGAFFLAGAAVFIYSFLFFDKVFDDTVVTLIIAGIQVFTLGLVADLIDKRMRR
jgi:glycosyltransferase involved in cell wall biosynthesis